MGALKRRKISESDKYFLLMISDYKCVNCGSDDNLEVDHIKPLARGGDDILENMQILCGKCNSRKRDTHDGIFDYDRLKTSSDFAEVILLLLEGRKKEAESLFREFMDSKGC